MHLNLKKNKKLTVKRKQERTIKSQCDRKAVWSGHLKIWQHNRARHTWIFIFQTHEAFSWSRCLNLSSHSLCCDPTLFDTTVFLLFSAQVSQREHYLTCEQSNNHFTIRLLVSTGLVLHQHWKEVFMSKNILNLTKQK